MGWVWGGGGRGGVGVERGERGGVQTVKHLYINFSGSPKLPEVFIGTVTTPEVSSMKYC